MDFLNRIFLNNSILSYLIVTCVIILMIFFKRRLSRYVSSLIYKIANRSWFQIDKRQFIDLFFSPLSWFLMLAVIVIAIGSLNFPAELNFKIYRTDLESIFDKIGIAIIIVAIINFMVSLVNFISLIIEHHASTGHEMGSKQLVLFFKDFIKAVFYIVGLILILKYVFNINIGTLVGGLGIATAALALAAKESIENFIASFIIFLDKPFYTGDNVKVNAYMGRVERIGIRSTRIRTNDKTLITVPNKQMVDSVVDNLSFRSYRRGEIKLELPTNYTSEKVTLFTNNVINCLKKFDEKLSSHSTFITDLNKNGIVITVEFFTIPIPIDDFTSLKQEIIIDVLELMKKDDIALSAAQSEIKIIQPNAEESSKSTII